MANTKLKIAFIGFRHNHVMGLYHAACASTDVEVVAAVEDDSTTVATLNREGKVRLKHSDWRDVIQEVSCDAIAVGDYFARRGQMIVAALKAKRHVISDKPICTTLNELDEIERLARENQRVVSAQLDLRDSGAFLAARRLIREGAIGDVHTIHVTAQHPLLLHKRPGWYFEPGKQGGTLNDIGVHATDLIPWLTGRRIAEVIAARAWNARLPQFPHFQDAAQCMLKLDNGGGVFFDGSYLAPDGIAYTAPQYWRVTCHGSDGMLEAKYMSPTILLARSNDATTQMISADADIPNGRLASFLRQVRGETSEGDLTTCEVIRASRDALLIQQAADQNRTNLPLK